MNRPRFVHVCTAYDYWSLGVQAWFALHRILATTGDHARQPVVTDVMKRWSDRGSTSTQTLLLVLHVVDQDVFAKTLGVCVENTSAIDSGHLINKLLQVVTLV